MQSPPPDPSPSTPAPAGQQPPAFGEQSFERLELERLRGRLQALVLPEKARASLQRQLDNLEHAAPASLEFTRGRSHLDWALELPWSPPLAPVKAPPFGHVARALAASHVGLEEVKGRIGEILAIRQLGGGARGTVICFDGPPGTGKSSMARAVAAALGREFVTIPVGAMIQERELVGASRREGACPGAILSGLHRCGSADPVILLDEIDKICLGGEGTAAGALLLLLDPEHNTEFLDHYLETPFDLSRCLFLVTANESVGLPEPLLDRMEVLSFNGYTEAQKFRIARRHLLPRAREHAGVGAKELNLSSGALKALIRGYTEEAGVRQLQRRLVSLARKAAVQVVQGGTGIRVLKQNLPSFLGPRTVEEEMRLERPRVGCATGLAWTSVGGALLPIEALAMPGSGRMILTGQIGEVMRESVQTVISHLRTCFGSLNLPQNLLEELDLHLHFPSAATPKDGPSGGIAIATALVSLLTSTPARHTVALTGEMSLHGAVLPVGGLREKLLAAIRCGIPEVVVPARNSEDVLRLPAEIREKLIVHRVEDVKQALELALLKRTPGNEKSAAKRLKASSHERPHPATGGKEDVA